MLDIRPYPKNAKKHDKKQIELLVRNIKEFGFDQPIIVDRATGYIVKGHGRWLAAQEMGLTETREATIARKGELFIPIEWQDYRDEQHANAARLADNRIQDMTGVDMSLVTDDLRLMGINDLELTGYDSDLIIDTKEDDGFSLGGGETEAKEGDLYQLGAHRLICGDSTRAETYQKLLGDERPRLIFTDPPYSVNYESTVGTSGNDHGFGYESAKFGGTGKIFNDNKTPEEALVFYTDIAKNLYAFSSDDASFYWWFASKHFAINEQALRGTGWHVSQQIIWLKNSLVFAYGQLFHRIYEPCLVGWKAESKHYKDSAFSAMSDVWTLDKKSFQDYLDVWYQKRDNTNTYIHPTQKPVQLAERALKRSSEIGDIVIDAFGGSGSTLIACEQLGRQARLIELDPKFVDAIIKRWEKLTNQKAEKLTP